MQRDPPQVIHCNWWPAQSICTSTLFVIDAGRASKVGMSDVPAAVSFRPPITSVGGVSCPTVVALKP